MRGGISPWAVGPPSVSPGVTPAVSIPAAKAAADSSVESTMSAPLFSALSTSVFAVAVAACLLFLTPSIKLAYMGSFIISLILSSGLI